MARRATKQPAANGSDAVDAAELCGQARQCGCGRTRWQSTSQGHGNRFENGSDFEDLIWKPTPALSRFECKRTWQTNTQREPSHDELFMVLGKPSMHHLRELHHLARRGIILRLRNGRWRPYSFTWVSARRVQDNYLSHLPCRASTPRSRRPGALDNVCQDYPEMRAVERPIMDEGSQSRELDGTSARHRSLKATPNDSGELRSCPKAAEVCPKVAQASLWEERSGFGHVWPTRAMFGRCWPNLSNILPRSTKTGRVGPKSWAKLWRTTTRGPRQPSWSNDCRVANTSRIWPTLARVRAQNGQTWPQSAEARNPERRLSNLR